MEKNYETSKLKSECIDLAVLSYKCLEKNPVKGHEVCRSFFDDYKVCRKEEHTALVEQRRSSGAAIK